MMSKVELRLNVLIEAYKNKMDEIRKLNEIWDAAWSKEGVEVEDLKATYVKEKIAK